MLSRLKKAAHTGPVTVGPVVGRFASGESSLAKILGRCCSPESGTLRGTIRAARLLSIQIRTLIRLSAFGLVSGGTNLITPVGLWSALVTDRLIDWLRTILST